MLFSIITPAFKQTDWLRLCIASVADQVGGEVDETGKLKLGGAEVIDSTQFSDSSFHVLQSSSHGLAVEHIIQDGGTPGIGAFIGEVAAQLGLTSLPARDGELLRASKPGYTLILISEPDQGMYDAINRGIRRITGDLWAWLNCDEQFFPGTLTYVAEWFASHPETDILCGDALLVDGEGKALSYRRIIPPRWHHTRLIHLASLSCASFYRRSIVERGGIFDTRWRSLGDAEWMARMLRAGVRVDACGRLLSSFAFTGQNTSESPLAVAEGVKWRSAPDVPPAWMRWPLTLHHRIRRLLAGAYKIRTLPYALHRKMGRGRVESTALGIGWNWPGGKEKKEVEDGKLKDAMKKRVSLVNHLRTVPVLGTKLAATSYRELSQKLIEFSCSSDGPLAVDFANTHVVTLRRHDSKFALLTECQDIIAPDGMPLVWVMNSRCAGLTDRVYGPTFTRKFLESCPASLTHYLVGGSVECGKKFRERMLLLNPGLQFVGSYHGRSDADGVLEDDEAVLKDILEKRPDFIWVGLGTPKQYGWMNRIKPKLNHGILLAVGFAFDVNAGTKPDTPAWMQRLGLGWLHRMASEPRRLLWRYVKYNSLFLWYLLLEELGVKGKDEVRRMKSSESDGSPERKLVTSVHKPDTIKLRVRNWGLRLADLFASDIFDCVSGKRLGRGLVIGFGRWTHMIGYEGRPLVPKFNAQNRLTYWQQRLGFTTLPVPNYTRLRVGTPVKQLGEPRVLNLLLTHQAGAAFEKLRQRWRVVCEERNLWVVFGGTREDFDVLNYPRKVYVDHPGLRVGDQQRDKQSYEGIFKAMAPVVEQEAPDYLYLCEYDHLPLIADLNRRQVQEIMEQGADVMGHWLYRIDGTGHYHQLYHEADPEFLPFWKSVSRRDDPTVVLSMFGSGSFWTREAFLAVAAQPQSIRCYLELYLPTLAHHLGFRVREWNEDHHLISNMPAPEVTVEDAMKYSCWTVHPVKE